MRRQLLFIISLLWIGNLLGQTTGYSPLTNPITPSTFQFLKVDELKANKYSGTAQIEIPLYTIEARNISIPLVLTYNGGGIRVAEEASWVGLGWNMEVGSIVQVVNDRDDLGDYEKILPDYYNYWYPYLFCERTNYPLSWPVDPPACFLPSVGIDQNSPRGSFVTYTDYTFPINGSYNYRNPNFFNSMYNGQLDEIDSEPDIFKANFLGHSFKFIVNFSTNELDVLDRSGYDVSIVSLGNGIKGIKVISPDGNTFEFFKADESKSIGSTTIVRNVEFVNGTQSLSSRIFHLTKIKDVDNQEIIFDYQNLDIINNLPSYSQTYKKMTASELDRQGECFYDRLYYKEDRGCTYGGGCTGGVNGLNPNSTIEDLGISYSNTQETKSYLISIASPMGNVAFNLGNRLDVVNEKSLESIEVTNYNDFTVKLINFYYSYFLGQDNGMGYDKETTHIIHHNKTSTELAYRLRLDSLGVNSTELYKFFYNTTALPLKSSYAVDYWGFYNGQTTNQSLIPNPIHLGITTLSSNSNDRRSYLEYTRAGALERITYPTKGVKYFDYELHTFTNNACQLINSGNGLRLKETGLLDNNEQLIKKVKYIYEGGKHLTPMSLFEQYYYYQHTSYSSQIIYHDMINVDTWYISSDNFYRGNPLGSGYSVGYDKVTNYNVDENDINVFGKTVDYYHNSPDIIDQRITPSFCNVLPARQDETKVENGLVYKTEYYRADFTVPIKTIENEYSSLSLSPVYYGARPAFNDYFMVSVPIFGTSSCNNFQYERNTIGYYPIYCGKSLLQTTTTRDLIIPGPPVITQKSFYYDQFENLTSTYTTRSDNYKDKTDYSYPYSPDVVDDPFMINLVALNRIDEKVKTTNSLYDVNNVSEKTLSVVQFEYDQFGTNIKKSIINERIYNPEFPGQGPSVIKTIIDAYDDHYNIIQYHKEGSTFKSAIYGYQDEKVIAITDNATKNECDYVGFEDHQVSGWQIFPSCSFNDEINNVKTGKSSIRVAGGYGPGKYFNVGVRALEHSGYRASVWVKGGTDAYLRIQVGDNTGIYKTEFNPNNPMGQWNLLTVDLPIVMYQHLISEGFNIKVYCGSNGTAFFDDLRFHPIDAQMISYTYFPLVGIASISDQNNKPVYYEYDIMGRLVLERDYLRNILKKYDYHYKQ